MHIEIEKWKGAIVRQKKIVSGKCIPEGKQIANKGSDWHGHARGIPRVIWSFKKTPRTFLSLTGDEKEESW